MSYFSEAFQPHLRLTALLVLAEAPAYRANSSIIHSAADEVGLPATRDQVRSELAWLEEQRLVTLTHPSQTLSVATLTERGLDVARGRAAVPGVQRPSPKA